MLKNKARTAVYKFGHNGIDEAREIDVVVRKHLRRWCRLGFWGE